MKFCKQCGRFFEDDDLAVCPDDGAPLRPFRDGEDPSRDPLLGTLVDGRFRVQQLIGRGGMGSVYRALQTSVEREVALKVIGDPVARDSAKRFMLEARTTSQLENVHTVTILDFGQGG